MPLIPQFRTLLVSLFFLTRVFSMPLAAQSWEFVKEKDGIKIYTRQEAGKSLKAYRGVAGIRAPAEKVFALIEDANTTDWWDPNLSQIKVLAYEKNKSAQYYLVFDAPWPVTDRDLCVNASVTINRGKGIFTVNSVSANGIVPERDDRVRIRDYRQFWTVTSTGPDFTQVVIEGYVDPAGDIPDWLSNMLITQSPLNAILAVRERMEGK